MSFLDNKPPPVVHPCAVWRYSGYTVSDSHNKRSSKSCFIFQVQSRLFSRLFSLTLCIVTLQEGADAVFH